MKRLFFQHWKIIGLSTLNCLFAAILFLTLKTLDPQLSGPNPWTSFLVWRLPLLLASSSILLRFICKNLSSKTSQKIAAFDRFFWISAPVGILIQMFSPFSTNPQLWFGFFFLTLWAAKSVLLATSLLTLQKHETLSGRMLFFVFFWFFGAHAMWQAPIHSIQGDEPHYLLMAHSVVHDGDLNLFNEYSEKAYQIFHPDLLEPKPSDYVAPGQIFSRGLGATFSVVFAPFYAIGGHSGAQIFIILCAAFLIAQLYQLISNSCSNPTTALISVMLVASTSPILIYSSLVYPDIFAALLIVIALRILKIPQSSKAGKSIPAYIVIITTVLLFTKFRYFVPVSLLLAPVFFRELKKRYNWIIFLTTLGIFGVSYIIIDHFILSGDLFLNRFGGISRISVYLPTFQDLRVLPGLLLDQESGLLVQSPIYFLVLAGIPMYRGKKDALYWFSILGTPLTALSLLGHFAWHSLPTPPLRYLLPLLPPTAMFIAHSLNDWKNRSVHYRTLAVFCVSISWVHAWLITLKPAWQINLATGTAAIFESLAEVIKSPVPSFFPSIIRPNSAVIPWSIIFCCILLVFYYPPFRDRKKRSVRLVPTSLLLVMLFGILLSRYVIGIFYSPIYHLEDHYQANPDGGHYYPENRDPFHHRELSYGWTFPEGTSASIPLVDKEDNFVCIARCKLVDSWLPQRLVINGKDTLEASTQVTSKHWKLYAFKLDPPTAINAINVKAPESNSGAIAVDYIKIIRKSSFKSNIWIKLADITRSAGFKALPLYCDRNALLTFPGDSLYELRIYFVPGAQPLKPPIAQEYPLSQKVLENVFNDALTAGWTRAHEFESLFRFSFANMIPKSQLLDYAVEGVLQGHQPSAQVMTRLDITSEADENLLFLRSIACYLQRRITLSVNILDDILIQGRTYPMCLTQPSKHFSVESPLYTFFDDMENNVVFSEHAQSLCNQHLAQSIKAFDDGDVQAAALFFNQFYSSDHDIFIKKIPLLKKDYLIHMFNMATRIHLGDIKPVVELLIKQNKPEAAHAAVQYALRTSPQHIDFRWLNARTLFQMKKFNQAKQACLENMALFHNNDSSRWLLERIKKEIVFAKYIVDNDDLNPAFH